MLPEVKRKVQSRTYCSLPVRLVDGIQETDATRCQPHPRLTVQTTPTPAQEKSKTPTHRAGCDRKSPTNDALLWLRQEEVHEFR